MCVTPTPRLGLPRSKGVLFLQRLGLTCPSSTVGDPSSPAPMRERAAGLALLVVSSRLGRQLVGSIDPLAVDPRSGPASRYPQAERVRFRSPSGPRALPGRWQGGAGPGRRWIPAPDWPHRFRGAPFGPSVWPMRRRLRPSSSSRRSEPLAPRELHSAASSSWVRRKRDQRVSTSGLGRPRIPRGPRDRGRRSRIDLETPRSVGPRSGENRTIRVRRREGFPFRFG